MSEPPPDDEDAAAELAPINPPLQLARAYLDNARHIGEPGSPSMRDAADLQAAHATMAQTAALVSIAESLDRIATTAPANQRRLQSAASSVDQLARELHRLRELARGRR